MTLLQWVRKGREIEQNETIQYTLWHHSSLKLSRLSSMFSRQVSTSVSNHCILILSPAACKFKFLHTRRHIIYTRGEKWVTVTATYMSIEGWTMCQIMNHVSWTSFPLLFSTLFIYGWVQSHAFDGASSSSTWCISSICVVIVPLTLSLSLSMITASHSTCLSLEEELTLIKMFIQQLCIIDRGIMGKGERASHSREWWGSLCSLCHHGPWSYHCEDTG